MTAPYHSKVNSYDALDGSATVSRYQCSTSTSKIWKASRYIMLLHQQRTSCCYVIKIHHMLLSPHGATAALHSKILLIPFNALLQAVNTHICAHIDQTPVQTTHCTRTDCQRPSFIADDFDRLGTGRLQASTVTAETRGGKFSLLPHRARLLRKQVRTYIREWIVRQGRRQ